jgi:hypothetical protein
MTKLTIEYHAGNPSLCRIPELTIRSMPECEGGGWYMPREQAEMLVRGVPAMTAKADTNPLREALAALVDLMDRFDRSNRNQADAYYALVKGADAKWDNARAALASEPVAGTVGREEIARVVDPGAFHAHKDFRHKHCSPLKVEVVQERAYAKADAILALGIPSASTARNSSEVVPAQTIEPELDAGGCSLSLQGRGTGSSVAMSLADELMGFHEACTQDSQGGDGQFAVSCSSGSAAQARALRAVLRNAATFLRSGQFATPPAPGADRAAVIEECAKFVEQHQETIRETSNGSERDLAPRKVGNLLGIAYVDGIRSLAPKGAA